MKPEDLSKLSIPSDPRLSPDGTSAAFVLWTPDVPQDENRRQIWLHRDAGARRFTNGPADSDPRWSPDGTRLAFLRKVEGSGPQVAVAAVDGGEPMVVSSFGHGVEAIEWSPDGSKLMVVAITPAPEWEDLDEEERKRRPRRIASVPYRFDNLGWTHDRRRHVWLVDPEGAEEPECLTEGPYDERFAAWSPDGRRIAFISDHSDNPGLVSGTHVWEVDIETKEISQMTPRGLWVLPSYRPDGVLHVLGNTATDFPVDAYLFRREQDGSMTDLSGHLDRSSFSLAAGKATVRWDGDEALIGVEDAGTFGVVRVAPDGTTERVDDKTRVVSGFDVAGSRTVFTASTWDSPGELYEVTAEGERQITELNTEDLGLIEPHHFRVGSDGHEIDVWVFTPDTDQVVPTLLNIHGGPASQYGAGFFDEFQIYAGAGYGVVACNPRGSSGRGIGFNREVVGEGWGEVDHRDVIAALEASLERFPQLDAERLGVMGGSYGGFLTAWILGREDRWRSAVVERGLLSWNSFVGTSDIGGVFPDYYTGSTYPDAWERWWELSPLSTAHNVTTPTLIIHAENDFRCPIEQAEQYFMALLRNGTTTELLRFPGEGHEMSRSGSPRHRLERFEAILDWHEQHLR